jgi:hypothetical protein
MWKLTVDIRGLVVAVVILLGVQVARAEYQRSTAAAPARPGVLVGDVSAPLGVHVMADRGMVVLLPSLPDGWHGARAKHDRRL